SPDGSRIAYPCDAAGAHFKLYVIEVASGQSRQITDGAYHDVQPRWSPDGRRLVFWSRRETVRTNADLFLVSADGAPRPGSTAPACTRRRPPDRTQISSPSPGPARASRGTSS